MHMRPLAHVDVVGWFYHPQIRQAPEPPTQDPNKPRNIDFFRLVRSATATVTQRHHKDALMGLWFIWTKVEMIGKFLTDHFPPANSCLGTDGIHPADHRRAAEGNRNVEKGVGSEIPQALLVIWILFSTPAFAGRFDEIATLNGSIKYQLELIYSGCLRTRDWGIGG
jgi:hypothetical protein